MKGNKHSIEITYDDCRKFKNEHPDLSRHNLYAHNVMYYKAMKMLNCLDELYPTKINTHTRYTDEELLEEAKKYSCVRDMKENSKNALNNIYKRNLQDKAFAHMKVLGDRMNRMIYAYEFPDNHVYVGLTYDIEHRDYQHKNLNKGAVNEYMKASGLEPTLKHLTDYLPVEEARKMEGFYVDKYRAEGWIILNKEATGGIGGGEARISKTEIIKLYNQGLSKKEIEETLGISETTVWIALQKAGAKHQMKRTSTPIEFIDDEGNVVMKFNSAKEAAEHFGINDQSVRYTVRKHQRCKGYHVRYTENYSRHQYKVA